MNKHSQYLFYFYNNSFPDFLFVEYCVEYKKGGTKRAFQILGSYIPILTIGYNTSNSKFNQIKLHTINCRFGC